MALPLRRLHHGLMPTLPRRPSRGTTLLELVTVLAILGILLGIAAPPLSRARERAAVAGARDAVAAALRRARAVAVARGGAALVVNVEGGRVLVVSGEGEAAAPPLDLREDYGVTVAADGAAAGIIELRYDAYGIGRMASRTLRFRRGAAERRLTISTYGRAQPW